MQNKKPPFEITEAALSDVMAIGELVGKNQLYTAAFFQPHPSPRKSNPFCGKIPIFKMQISNSYWMFPPQQQAGFLPH